MGFFGKLKQNFTHGGIKLQLAAPATVSENDVSFQAAVTVLNQGEAVQTVGPIVVSLIEDRSETDAFQATDTQQNQGNREMASATSPELFELQPGETKSIDVTVPINIGKFAEKILPQNSGLAAVANILGKVESVSEALNNQHFRHFVQASAKVQGISFGASAQSEIRLLKPGELGVSINL